MDPKVQKSDASVGTGGRETNITVLLVGKSKEIVKFCHGHRGDAHNVVNITEVQIRFRTRESVENGLLQKAHEKARIARTHFGAHGNTLNLKIKITIEFKRVESEHQFSELDDGGNVYVIRWVPIQKVFNGLEPFLVGDGRI